MHLKSPSSWSSLPASYFFDVAHAGQSMALLIQGVDSYEEGKPVVTDLRVYIRGQSPWFAPSGPWIPLGPSIDPNNVNEDSGYDSGADKREVTIRAVALADEAGYVPEGVVVATNLVSIDSDFEKDVATVQVWTPQPVVPNDDPEGFPTGVEWIAIGGPIKGNNILFGMHMKLSSDGSILALSGSYDLPKEDDDDGLGNLSCFIRLFQFDESQGWIQKGTDMKLPKDPYGILCPDITFSGDGSTVVTGMRGYEESCPHHPAPHGHVQAWHWDAKNNDWSRKGPDLESFFPKPDSTEDFFFGQQHSLSHDGNRIVLSARESFSLTRANDAAYTYYLNTMDWKKGNWTQKAGNTVEVDTFSSFAIDKDCQTLAVGTFIRDVPMSGLVNTYHYFENEGEENMKILQLID